MENIQFPKMFLQSYRVGFFCACRKRVIQIRALSPDWREGFEDRLEKAGIEVDRKKEPEDGMCGPDGEVFTS